MRNLKRVLSLALASVMLMGMMVMGASAAESTTYSDKSSIKYGEAVDVMTAIGVFNGTDGKFNPTGALTRESAAKIITYMMMGKEAADGLSTTAAPFTDVAANRWSAGSIAYCVSQGIISGDGQGHFYPELTVNGAAFAKMLLGALGYKAGNENMTGSGWEVAVATLVRSAGLNSGLNVVLSKDMTREQAAKMAFNAMKAQTASYIGGTTIDVNGVPVTVGGSRQLSGKDEKGNVISFASQNYPTLKSSTTSKDGRPSTKWVYGTPAKEVGVYAKSADFTYSAKADKDDVKDELDGYAFTKIVNDAPVSSLTLVANTKVDGLTVPTNAEDVAALTANGRLVEVYAEDGVVTKVVVTDTYLATVSSVNTVKKAVTVTGYGQVGEKDAGYDILSGLKKDDKVLVNVTNAKKTTIIAVAIPTTAEGTYSNKDKDNVRTIGGEDYKDNVTFDATKVDKDAGMKMGTDYSIVLDTYGFLIGASATSTAADKYAYVASTDVVGSNSTGKTYQAKLVFEDGTQEWVEVSSVDDEATSDMDGATDAKWLPMTTAKAVTYGVKTDGTYSVETIGAGTANGNVSADADNDKTYTYTSVKTDPGKVSFKITKGEPEFLTKNGTSVKAQASAKTVFLVKSGSTYKTYVGVKNVPTMEGVTCTIVVPADSTTASIVVIGANDGIVDSASLVYITSAKYSEKYDADLKKTVRVYPAIIKGEVTTLTTTLTSDKTAGIYKATYNDSGYATALTQTVEDLKNTVTDASQATIKDGTITLNGESYVTSDIFKVLLVDTDGVAVEIEAGNVEDYTIKSTTLIKDTDGKFVDTMIVVEKTV